MRLFCVDCGELFEEDDIRLYACDNIEECPECGGELVIGDDE